MAQYIVERQATSNSSANTEDVFLQWQGAASTGFFLKRVRISCNTPNSDVDITARIIQETTVTGAGTTVTSNPKRPTAPAATTLVTGKNGTNAFGLGTVSKTFDQVNVNGRAIWEWIPRGNEEYYDSGSAGVMAIAIAVSSASIVLNVTGEYEE